VGADEFVAVAVDTEHCQIGLPEGHVVERADRPAPLVDVVLDCPYTLPANKVRPAATDEMSGSIIVPVNQKASAISPRTAWADRGRTDSPA
jgi:hypothetical protein